MAKPKLALAFLFWYQPEGSLDKSKLTNPNGMLARDGMPAVTRRIPDSCQLFLKQLTPDLLPELSFFRKIGIPRLVVGSCIRIRPKLLVLREGFGKPQQDLLKGTHKLWFMLPVARCFSHATGAGFHPSLRGRPLDLAVAAAFESGLGLVQCTRFLLRHQLLQVLSCFEVVLDFHPFYTQKRLLLPQNGTFSHCFRLPFNWAPSPPHKKRGPSSQDAPAVAKGGAHLFGWDGHEVRVGALQEGSRDSDSRGGRRGIPGIPGLDFWHSFALVVFFWGFEGPILAGAQWGFHFGFGLVGDFPDLKALWRVIGKPPPSKTTSRPGSNSGFGWFLPLIVDPAGLDKR